LLIKKNIIITGALGQDGLILSKILLKKNKYKVIGIIKKKNRNNKLKNKNILYKNINLLNFKLIIKLLNKFKPECIVHLAAINSSNHKANKSSFNKYYKKNTKIVKNLIKAVIAVDKKIKFIFAGSSQMYSLQRKKIINESTSFKSILAYGKYKIDSHNFLMKIKKKYDLNITTAILFNHDSKFRNSKFLLPRIAYAVKFNKFDFLKKIYRADISEDLTHADDICNGIYLIIKSKKNFNKIILSSKKITRFNDIIDYLLRKKKSSLVLKKNNNLKNNTCIGDNSFAKKNIKWRIKKTIYDAGVELLEEI
jgi:GDP-D-mannose dehydratase